MFYFFFFGVFSSIFFAVFLGFSFAVGSSFFAVFFLSSKGVDFFAAGFSLRYLAGIIAVATPALLYLMLAKPYRRKRILAFFHPWDDPRGVGFQIIQSFLALGSGGIFGRGLGGSQQKLFFLPESHTDFIFSIIGEELGFVGAAAVIILFLVFIFLYARNINNLNLN